MLEGMSNAARVLLGLWWVASGVLDWALLTHAAADSSIRGVLIGVVVAQMGVAGLWAATDQGQGWLRLLGLTLLLLVGSGMLAMVTPVPWTLWLLMLLGLSAGMGVVALVTGRLTTHGWRFSLATIFLATMLVAIALGAAREVAELVTPETQTRFLVLPVAVLGWLLPLGSCHAWLTFPAHGDRRVPHAWLALLVVGSAMAVTLLPQELVQLPVITLAQAIYVWLTVTTFAAATRESELEPPTILELRRE
ncbi:MAG: hypothetical protein WD045_10965 [Pirellulaceae bacterium]